MTNPCQSGWHHPALSLFAKVSIAFSCTLPKMAYFFKVRVCAAMKGIPIHYALDLCAVDKDFFVFCFFQFGKPFYKLVEQILYYFFRLSASEPGKRRVVRHLLSLKEPDKVDILAACKLQFPGGVDAALSCILFLL